MRQIIEIYGKFLLDAVAAILLAALLMSQVQDGEGNRGIFRIIGAELENSFTDAGAGDVDFEIYQSEGSRAAPAFSYTAPGSLLVGSLKVSDFVLAVDCEGRELPIKVLGVQGAGGDELLDAAVPGEDEIYISKPGIYTVTVYAVDESRKRATCRICVPVNR